MIAIVGVVIATLIINVHTASKLCLSGFYCSMLLLTDGDHTPPGSGVAWQLGPTPVNIANW